VLRVEPTSFAKWFANALLLICTQKHALESRRTPFYEKRPEHSNKSRGAVIVFKSKRMALPALRPPIEPNTTEHVVGARIIFTLPNM
jgi:hypothetical protein